VNLDSLGPRRQPWLHLPVLQSAAGAERAPERSSWRRRCRPGSPPAPHSDALSYE